MDADPKARALDPTPEQVEVARALILDWDYELDDGHLTGLRDRIARAIAAAESDATLRATRAEEALRAAEANYMDLLTRWNAVEEAAGMVAGMTRDSELAAKVEALRAAEQAYEHWKDNAATLRRISDALCDKLRAAEQAYEQVQRAHMQMGARLRAAEERERGLRAWFTDAASECERTAAERGPKGAARLRDRAEQWRDAAKMVDRLSAAPAAPAVESASCDKRSGEWQSCATCGLALRVGEHCPDDARATLARERTEHAEFRRKVGEAWLRARNPNGYKPSYDEARAFLDAIAGGGAAGDKESE